MNDEELKIILDGIEEHDIKHAINRLDAETEFLRQLKIRNRISELKEEIRRLNQCLM